MFLFFFFFLQISSNLQKISDSLITFLKNTGTTNCGNTTQEKNFQNASKVTFERFPEKICFSNVIGLNSYKPRSKIALCAVFFRQPSNTVFKEQQLSRCCLKLNDFESCKSSVFHIIIEKPEFQTMETKSFNMSRTFVLDLMM